VNAISSSYEFHKTLESPLQFGRREWRALAIFGGGFVVILLLGAFTVSPAYFYPRLRTDTLLYYLKALTFAETGHTTATAAINLRPFHYQSMPGVLRSPFLVAFRDFDSQLRAIQIFNAGLVAVTTSLYAYILSWTVPRKWHSLSIGFAFGFTLLSPEWVANVFEMLADAPYAFFSILCVIITARILTSSTRLTTHWLAIATALVLFISAFLTRFTAPVLLVYAAALAAGRVREYRISRRVTFAAVIAAVVCIATLVVLNWPTITAIYLVDITTYLARGSKSGMLINLFTISLPAQIIPDLWLALTKNPTGGTLDFTVGSTPRDLVILMIGLAVSCVTLFGIWRTRMRFAPEIAYTLGALPVLSVLIPSTTRYLMAYQPFLWIFFYNGAATFAQPVAVRVTRRLRAAFVGLALLFAAGTGLVLLRTKKMKIGGSGGAISFGDTRRYAPEIASTFESLRRFLEKLPRERSLLIGEKGAVGRWRVISGLDYYYADTALARAVATRDTYVVLECGTLDTCSGLDDRDARTRRHLNKFGPFHFDPVFSREGEHARARVYRLRPAVGPTF